tara:strand:+ start:10767 stop:11372 length:606 start_codon:yes stop_codon:yes gene_type:complete
MNTKFVAGANARKKWSKNLCDVKKTMTMKSYNEMMGGVFQKICNIVLDPSNKRQSTLMVDVVNKSEWDEKTENIYVLVRNGNIMKIGGTRDGMKGRWSSYGCGYYVPERCNKKGESYPGKMSVTNAYLYHTIETDLLENGSKWEFYTWKLPRKTFTISIADVEVDVIAQTFHAYESVCIKKFEDENGYIPFLCYNSDPDYK